MVNCQAATGPDPATFALSLHGNLSIAITARTHHIGLLQDQGKWFYAVLKATKTGKAVFLQSFRKTKPADALLIRGKSVLERVAK